MWVVDCILTRVDMNPGKSVPTAINIVFGNFVDLFEGFATLIGIFTYGIPLKIPEAGRTIRFGIKLGYDAM